MPETTPWPRAIPFKKLQKSLSRLVETLGLDPRQEFKLGKGKARIPMESLPLRLSFGDTGGRLELYLETALSANSKMYRTGNILLREPE